ncbi:LptA/OstA family protein [Candidatus Francisella endociliophora]|uniref:LptA/OstA family protein n=1 Tax=Candidatus Francisella endociliophora TaxID=653937 RepID=UPI0009DDDD5C|nr:LptA/OstA family protein [Francisella sp. FSC1006]
MRQAKYLMLAALCLSFSYGISLDKDAENINYNSSKYNTSMKEDKVADSEKEDNSANNVLKDYGPITICADRAVYDDDKKTLTYYDNVFVIQIHNMHILCKKPKTSIKKGTTYFVRDNKIPFNELQKKWFKHVKKLCSKEKECNFISGQKLLMQLGKDKEVKTLEMESKGEENSQLYNYPTDANPDFSKSKEVTKGPVEGVSKKIIYNVAKKDLELNKKAVVTQNGNRYKGEKVNYDMNHDLISIPGSRHKRSTIVLDGVAEQTKIDVGLTPISEYHKDANSGSTMAFDNNSNTDPTQPQNEIM